jgi:hypothetical protein
MAKLTYFGSVDNAGILKITNRNAFNADLRDLSGKEIRLTIERKAKRSDPQNRYLHGVIIPIVKAHLLDLGWKDAKSNDWVKNYIKYNCLIVECVNEENGEVIKSLGETSGLTTSEFMDFVADIQQWAATELGLIVPDPGQVLEMEL